MTAVTMSLGVLRGPSAPQHLSAEDGARRFQTLTELARLGESASRLGSGTLGPGAAPGSEDAAGMASPRCSDVEKQRGAWEPVERDLPALLGQPGFLGSMAARPNPAGNAQRPDHDAGNGDRPRGPAER